MIKKQVLGVTTHVYESYSRLFESHIVPIPEIEAALSKFNFQAAILRLSQFNIILAQGRLEGSTDEIQNDLCQEFLDDSIIQRINDKYAGKVDHPPFIFFRHLLLYMMRLCAGACPVEGGTLIDSLEEKRAFGWCCIWAADHVATEADNRAISEGSKDDRRRALGPQIATLAELGSPPDMKQSLARAYIFFRDLVHDTGIVKRSGRFDFLRAFKDVAGISIDDYYNIVLFIITWYYGHDVRQMLKDTSKFLVHFREYIALTHVAREAGDSFLALNATPINQLPSLLLNHRGAPNRDFSSIQNRPLCEIESGVVACLDLDFMLEKLRSGVYRLISEGYTGAQKEGAQTAWGYLFEEYVNRLIGGLYPRSRSSSLVGSFVDSPTYTTRQEAFDGLLISPTNPRHLYVFQYKSQLFKPEIKYTDDVDAFERALDRKGSFGVGRKGGVRQLVDNIELLWHQDRGERKELLPPLGAMSGYEKITPVLVVLETFFMSDFLNWTLNKRFQTLLAGKKISGAVDVKPLMVIDIESLEILKPYIQSGFIALSQAINSLNEYDKERLAAFRRHVAAYLSPFPDLKDTEVEETFDRIIGGLGSLLKDEE